MVSAPCSGPYIESIGWISNWRIWRILIVLLQWPGEYREDVLRDARLAQWRSPFFSAAASWKRTHDM